MKCVIEPNKATDFKMQLGRHVLSNVPPPIPPPPALPPGINLKKVTPPLAIKKRDLPATPSKITLLENARETDALKILKNHLLANEDVYWELKFHYRDLDTDTEVDRRAVRESADKFLKDCFPSLNLKPDTLQQFEKLMSLESALKDIHLSY